MAYSNFMSAFTGGRLFAGRDPNIVGKASWDHARGQGYNEKQIKRAVQQLRDSDSGIKPGGWLADRIRQINFGIYHKDDPLGKYQGPQGGLGIKGYQDARRSFEASKIKELLPNSGMNFGALSQAQYDKDIKIENQREVLNQQNEELRDQMDEMVSMYEQKVNEPQKPTTISRSAPYAVGTSGNASLKAESKATSGKSSSKRSWNRYGADFKTALNAVAASGKPSPSKSLNV